MIRTMITPVRADRHTGYVLLELTDEVMATLRRYHTLFQLKFLSAPQFTSVTIPFCSGLYTAVHVSLKMYWDCDTSDLGLMHMSAGGLTTWTGEDWDQDAHAPLLVQTPSRVTLSGPFNSWEAGSGTHERWCDLLRLCLHAAGVSLELAGSDDNGNCDYSASDPVSWPLVLGDTQDVVLYQR